MGFSGSWRRKLAGPFPLSHGSPENRKLTKAVATTKLCVIRRLLGPFPCSYGCRNICRKALRTLCGEVNPQNLNIGQESVLWEIIHVAEQKRVFSRFSLVPSKIQSLFYCYLIVFHYQTINSNTNIIKCIASNIKRTKKRNRIINIIISSIQSCTN